MGIGLKIFSPTGYTILDTSSQVGKILGTITIREGYENGSITDENIGGDTIFIVPVPNSSSIAAKPFHGDYLAFNPAMTFANYPQFTQNGNKISWTYNIPDSIRIDYGSGSNAYSNSVFEINHAYNVYGSYWYGIK